MFEHPASNGHNDAPQCSSISSSGEMDCCNLCRNSRILHLGNLRTVRCLTGDVLPVMPCLWCLACDALLAMADWRFVWWGRIAKTKAALSLRLPLTRVAVETRLTRRIADAWCSPGITVNTSALKQERLVKRRTATIHSDHSAFKKTSFGLHLRAAAPLLSGGSWGRSRTR